jgi:carboxyl-terminal processing protease
MEQPSSRRPPLAAVLAFLLPVLLVAGLWLGGHPEHLPGFLKKAFVANHSTLVVDEAINRIAHDYYRPIGTSKLDDASIAGVVKSLDDRFSHYLTKSEFGEFISPPHFAGIGVVVNPLHSGLLIARVFDSSPASRAGLKDGELIVGVGKRRLAGLSAEASTALIRGQPGTAVQLEVRTGIGSHAPERTLMITRELVSEPVVASAGRTVHGIKLGVVALAEFSAGAHGEVREAIEKLLHEKAKGIVFDLRGNGGGLVSEAQLIASIFLPAGQTVVSTRGRTQPSQTLTALGDPIASSIPVVVLVDSGTASAAEIVTGALQDHHRATVVGTHTFGKGVFQEEEPLSNGGALDITVGEYFTPNGRNLGGGGVKQGAGITPEVKLATKVVDTPAGLSAALSTLAAKVK